MHGALAIAVITLGLGAISAQATPLAPPARLLSLSDALTADGVDAGQWETSRPGRCQGEAATAACKSIQIAWESWLDVPHAGRQYSVELWVIPQSSPAAAKRLIKLLEYDDEFGGTFGKAPETHFLCHDTVLTTVGTYRGPRPHTKVNEVVRPWITDHCGPAPKS